MLDKRTFCKLFDTLERHTVGMSELELLLHVTFDGNFLTHTLDDTLNIIAESFFSDEQLADLDCLVYIETVKDILYHYAFTCEFGLKTDKLRNLYIEDEGMSTEQAFDAFAVEDVYNIITRYLNSENTGKKYTIRC